MITFDGAELSIPCLKCGAEAKKTIAWLKANDRLTCAACGITINLDTSELMRGLDEADRTLRDFKRSMQSAAVTLKLRL